MYISVELHGQFRQNLKTSSMEFPFEKNMQVQDVVSHMKSQHPHFTFDEKTHLVVVNGHSAQMTKELAVRDSVAFLPLFGGG